MEVHFYSFSKRENSTKQPTGQYTNVNVTLKEPTSVTDPVLVLSGNHLTDYTYAHIPSFNRYYFVGEVVSIATDLIQLTLHEDYLATWKSNIQSTRAMILRCSTGYNKWINDRLIRVNSKKILTTVADASKVKPSFYQTQPGTYILNVISQTGSSNGFCTTYALDLAGINTLAYKMLDNNILDQLRIYFTDPWSAIINCIWLPIDYSNIPRAQGADVYIGDWNSNISGKLINEICRIPPFDFKTPIPVRHNDFRDYPPYSNFMVTIPGYGAIPIDMANYVGETEIELKGHIDLMTGDVSYYYNNNTISFNISQPVAVSQVADNIGTAVSGVASLGASAVSMVGGLATGGIGAVGGIVGFAGLAASSASTLSSMTEGHNVKGSIGSRSNTNTYNTWRCEYYEPETSNPDSANYIATCGRPFEEVDLISNHSGYIECSNASVTGAMFDSERNAVNSYLNSGFYLE